MNIKLFFLFQSLTSMFLYAQPGNLDLTFANNGVAITDVSPTNSSDFGDAVIINNNKILATGSAINSNGGSFDFALAQYNLDGSLDSSFGNNGIVTMDLNGSSNLSICSVIQSDNKIITVGVISNFNRDVAIVRFNADGSLDTSYANNGIFIYDNGFGDDFGKWVDILPDNSIIVGCQTTSSILSKDYTILKLNELGNLDLSFGDNGKMTTNIGNNDGLFYLKIQNDNKILVTGSSSKSDSGNGDVRDKVLLRYTSDGFLDTTFNNTGIIFTSFESGKNDYGTSSITQTDGKIVVSGYSGAGTGETPQFAMSRYNQDGGIDISFGIDGTTLTDFGPGRDLCYSSVIQPDGKIILGGINTFSTTNFAGDIILARYDVNGLLDQTFGTNGLVISNLNHNLVNQGRSLALQPDNKLLFLGASGSNSSPYNFTLARFLTDENLEINDYVSNSKIYFITPNPASEGILVQNNTSDNKMVNIEIYSSIGEKIKSVYNYIPNLQQSISLKNMSNGIYLIKITNNKTTEVIKLIKE